MRQAYRYEMRPNKTQIVLLRKHCGAARYAYNWGIDRHLETSEILGEYTNAIGLLKLWTKQKPEWAKEISRRVIEGALRNLDTAFKNYRRYKQKRARGIPAPKVGPPTPKKKGRHDSASFFGPTIRIEGNHVILPTLKAIRLKETPRVKGSIKSAVVSLEVDRWFVSLQVERTRHAPGPRTGGVVGVALGITEFATIEDSNGLSIEQEAPRPLKAALKKVQRMQRWLSRKEVTIRAGGKEFKVSNKDPRPGNHRIVTVSQNYKKQRLLLAKAYYRMRNLRKDFLHKLSTHLTKTYGLIIVQDFRVKEMLRKDEAKKRQPGWVTSKSLRRFIGDMGWYTFRSMLEYKSEWYGSEVLVAEVDFPSAKKCSRCGNVKDVFPLSERIYHCEGCDFSKKRGKNTASNLLQYGTVNV